MIRATTTQPTMIRNSFMLDKFFMLFRFLLVIPWVTKVQ
jgi:hypothetical protein